MRTARTAKVALVWAQFIPAHVDRIRAVHARLEGKARLVAVEVASTSTTYGDFTPTGAIDGIEHHLLFPGRSIDTIPGHTLLWALFRSLRPFDLVCIGVPYSVPIVMVLVALLRLCGTRVVLVYDSKFDDKPRRAWFELCKAVGLSLYSAAIVASARSRDYLRFLGFRRRFLLGGANGISLQRLRDHAEQGGATGTVPFVERDFIYVGRFAEVKNLPLLLAGFAAHASADPASRRRLVLVGAGPEEAQLRALAGSLGIADRVVFPGFKEGPELAAALARSLALVLVSTSEPWGLVVNEALALGLPVIASEAPGARDLLVRNLVNGYVVPAGSVESLVCAMTLLGRDEAAWQAMRDASLHRAWLGDCARFADAVELLVDPAAEPAAGNMACLLAAFDEAPVQPVPVRAG